MQPEIVVVEAIDGLRVGMEVSWDESSYDAQSTAWQIIPGTLVFDANDEHKYQQPEPAVTAAIRVKLLGSEDAPAITTTTLPGGTVGTPYHHQLQATGGGFILWELFSGELPDGLTLKQTTGEISGTPTAEQTAQFTVRALNSVGNDKKELSITITNAPAAEHTVTVITDGNGTASASSTSATAGTEITLTATPNTGYHFKEWQVMSGGVTIKDDKFLMPNDNVEVKAIFEKDAPPAPTEFIVTFDGNGGTPSVGSMTTTNRKLTSLPSASRSGSYSFDGWYTKKSGGTKITTDTVFHANTTVYAHWTYTGGGSSGYSYYTIKATAGTGGSISPSGNVSVREGGDQTFTITPDKGYAVSTVKIDGKSIGAVKSYTFENVSRTHTIEVIFVKGTASASTGDSSNLPLWCALLLASTITLAGAVHYKRKRAR